MATTVIFETGFGQDESTWSALSDELNANTDFKLVQYTRPSVAKADSAPTTIEQDVHFLLQQIQHAKDEKIILVGHSYGGLIVTEAAQRFPELITGIVLLEPTVRSQRMRFKAIDGERISKDDELLKQYLPNRLKAQYELLIQQLDTSSADTQPLPTDLPVVLFTSTQQPTDPMFFEETVQGKAQWLALHQALVAESKPAIHVRSSRFGHNPHQQVPTKVSQFIQMLSDGL